MIALNKIDKDGIDVEESKARIMNQLLEHDIVTEDVGLAGESEYGPPVQMVPVSGLTGQGLDQLIESLALQSEIMDLRADVEARAEGLVMEASVDQGLGVTAHCVVRWGSLQRGDVVVSGTCWGKVKVLKDGTVFVKAVPCCSVTLLTILSVCFCFSVHDAALDKALPSQPIQIIGFSSMPKAGDPFVCVASEELAKQLTERRKTMQIEKDQAAATLDVPPPQPQQEDDEAEPVARKRRQRRGLQSFQVDVADDDGSIRIPMVVKADTDATLAAVRESLQGLVEESSHPIVLDWVNVGVGPITTAEVMIAKQVGATIFTFGLGKRKNDVKHVMETEGVDTRDHSIIYALMDDAKQTIAKYLPPTVEDVLHGKGRVQAIFNIKGSHVAGLKVLDGKLFKENSALQGGGGSLPCHYRVIRNGEIISPSAEDDAPLKVSSLKKVKEDVVEVKKGEECGLVLEDFDDIQVDDVIECYSTRVTHAFS
jgi:translation initiation factor IF-2